MRLSFHDPYPRKQLVKCVPLSSPDKLTVVHKAGTEQNDFFSVNTLFVLIDVGSCFFPSGKFVHYVYKLGVTS